MASFMQQEQVMMSGKPTQAVLVSYTDPNGHAIGAKNVIQNLFSRKEAFAAEVTDKVDPTLHTKDELYEDMQELFKDEAEAFGELHELQEFIELGDFCDLDELLKPVDHINEERAEFTSNSSGLERLVPTKPEEKKLEKVQQRPLKASNHHAQTSHRATQAAHRPVQSPHRPVRPSHVPLHVGHVPVQATHVPVRVTPHPVQVAHPPQQARHRPAQGSYRPPNPSCLPVQASPHRPPKASCRPMQASDRGPSQAPSPLVQASHHRPPKVPYQPVQVSHRRPPKAPTRPAQASRQPSATKAGAAASQRPLQAPQYAPPSAPYARAPQRAAQRPMRVGEVTAEQILEYLGQPPVTNASPPVTTASMRTGEQLAPNPRVLQHAPASIVSPGSIGATLQVGGHPIPSSGGLHQMNHATGARTNMKVPVAVRNHLVPRSGVMHQPRMPVTRNGHASAVPVDPRVKNSRNPQYENVHHAAMGLSLQSQMVQNPNVPVVNQMARGVGQEIRYSRGMGMNQLPMGGQSGLKRKSRQEHVRVVRQRSPGTNGPPFIQGNAPVAVPQTPVYAIPVQQNAYPVAGEKFSFATGQGNPMYPHCAINGGVPTSTPVHGQPVQQIAQTARHLQMLPPKPRRKMEHTPARPQPPAGQPTSACPPTPAGPSKSTKPAKAPTPSKPPRAPRGGNAAQNGAKRKAEAPPNADGAEKPKKRTRTRIEDLDPAAVHVCDYEGCTKKFAKKYNLKIHQRRHSGDLPFTCDHEGCDKRFMWLSSYSRHSRVHKSKGRGGRKKKEPQAEAQQDVDLEPAEEPDIAIADMYSVFSVGRLQHVVENEKSDQVTTACSLTALDAKPCQNLVPASKNAQSQRHNYLCGARAEEFYRYLTTPYHVDEPQLQSFCDVLTVATDPDRYMQDPTVFVNI